MSDLELRTEPKIWQVYDNGLATPPYFFDLVVDWIGHGFDRDVCAAPKTTKCPEFWTADDDCITQKAWPGWNWMNPPYEEGIIEFFVERARHEARHLRGATLALFPAKKSEYRWFTDYVAHGSSAIIYVEKRIKYHRNGVPLKQPNHASVMVAWVPGYLDHYPAVSSFHRDTGGKDRVCPDCLRVVPRVDGSWPSL
jgi:hypothetical protein